MTSSSGIEPGPLGGTRTNNKLNPHRTSTPGLEPRPHCMVGSELLPTASLDKKWHNSILFVSIQVCKCLSMTEGWEQSRDGLASHSAECSNTHGWFMLETPREASGVWATYNLGQIRWKIKTTPPPPLHFNDGKMVRFALCANSSLILGEGGLISHFNLSKIVGLSIRLANWFWSR